MHPTAKILATPMSNQTVLEIELLQEARILCRAFLITLIYAKMCDRNSVQTISLTSHVTGKSNKL